MIRSTVLVLSFVALSGCNILFPEDPRVGTEGVEDCSERVALIVQIEFAVLKSEADRIWVPTYTYDITKLGLEEIQALSQSSRDERVGTTLDLSTNQTSTAVDAFMAQPVDENGAFFLGRDPALYRVRGEAVRFDQAIASGCERQQANMRLIDVDLAPSSVQGVELENSTQDPPQGT